MQPLDASSLANKNEEPPFVPVITGYDGTLHDPRGRVWMFRVNASM